MPIDQPQNDPETWCGIILAGGAASRLGGVNKGLATLSRQAPYYLSAVRARPDLFRNRHQRQQRP